MGSSLQPHQPDPVFLRQFPSLCIEPVRDQNCLNVPRTQSFRPFDLQQRAVLRRLMRPRQGYDRLHFHSSGVAVRKIEQHVHAVSAQEGVFKGRLGLGGQPDQSWVASNQFLEAAVFIAFASASCPQATAGCLRWPNLDGVAKCVDEQVALWGIAKFEQQIGDEASRPLFVQIPVQTAAPPARTVLVGSLIVPIPAFPGDVIWQDYVHFAVGFDVVAQLVGPRFPTM